MKQYTILLESFYIILECPCLQKANSHRPLQIIWLLRSIYPPWWAHNFDPRSFMALHSKEIHMPSLIFHRFCKYLRVQNLRYELCCHNLSDNFRVSNLDARFLTYVYTRFRWSSALKFYRLPLHPIFAWKQYDRKAHLFPCIPWPERDVWESKWSHKVVWY